MKNTLRLKPILLSAICYLLSTVILFGCQNKTMHKDTRVIMGTFVEVISPDQRAARIVFDEISRIDQLLSKYKPDSEISRLNRLGKLRVSSETIYLLQKAKEFYLMSGGDFDITVGPLLDLWGFSEHKYNLPSKDEIKKAKSRVGFDKIILKEGDNMIEFSVPGMKVDLGGIAKGFAVDCAVKKLKEAGVVSCLINAGGQIYALGDKPPHQNLWCGGEFGSPWQIAIRNPRTEGIVEILRLKDKAVSTSGDYQQFFLKDKKRYAHIFNPRTGEPVNSAIASVTVIASDGLTADALSTTIFAIGTTRWEELSKRFPDVRVKIIEEKDVRGAE